MHEAHLMARVAALAAERVRPGARLVFVRLKVSARSHLLADGGEAARAAFARATCGTPLDGAGIELIPVPVGASCRACGARGEWDGLTLDCRACGAGPLAVEEAPEALLHELVLEDVEE